MNFSFYRLTMSCWYWIPSLLFSHLFLPLSLSLPSSFSFHPLASLFPLFHFTPNPTSFLPSVNLSLLPFYLLSQSSLSFTLHFAPNLPSLLPLFFIFFSFSIALSLSPPFSLSLSLSLCSLFLSSFPFIPQSLLFFFLSLSLFLFMWKCRNLIRNYRLMIYLSLLVFLRKPSEAKILIFMLSFSGRCRMTVSSKL